MAYTTLLMKISRCNRAGLPIPKISEGGLRCAPTMYGHTNGRDHVNMILAGDNYVWTLSTIAKLSVRLAGVNRASDIKSVAVTGSKFFPRPR
jgi:hypothetical protein